SGFSVPQLGQDPPATSRTIRAQHMGWVRSITNATHSSWIGQRSRRALALVVPSSACATLPRDRATRGRGSHELTRIRTLVAALVIALPIPAAVAGCGSSGSGSNNEDPTQVLKETFNNPTKITSGNLAISLSGSAEGSQSGNLSATIDGPFQAD